MKHAKTPIFDAVKKYIESNVIPFHVPGHKHGSGLSELTEYIGEKALKMDLNGMPDLDFLNNPSGVIKEAEQLIADAYGAQNAYILVNGGSSGVQAMIMCACNPGDKIIIPRNVHKSAIGGVILSGAVPVYVQPEVNNRLGIAMGITEESLLKAIKEHPHTKALFLVNPTYYGFTSNIKSLVRIAHQHGLIVLIDEAHAAHMPFHDDFPLTAMEVGADMSTVSTHKTGGSLTQSAILLQRNSKFFSPQKVRQVLNLTYTTSASYLLMSSIDVARKQLVLKGREMLQELLDITRWARSELNNIEGIYAYGKELIGTPGCHDFDELKLGINLSDIGYTGYQAEGVLRKEFNIQMELSDLHNILPYVGIGDKRENLEKLIEAFKYLAANPRDKNISNTTFIPHNPKMIVTPRDAFYSNKKSVPLEDSVGEIAGEMVMAYPPGIPVICLGEKISKEIVDYIKRLKEERCQIQGTSDPSVEYIQVLGAE